MPAMPAPGQVPGTTFELVDVDGDGPSEVPSTGPFGAAAGALHRPASGPTTLNWSA
ncbi:hypothetical protein J4573_52410 [Actinomadura barringtoniae]|uniref:Uncharacterized protein n=1 Tax=Actinomadura barringtoniae TaxID=1427535 RepID=A0A939PNT2_9ACTN|nr:hypothetical protein [Actinomadura barringtoniae]MBO2455762.1 hypothetical protein [Actinomadura barringtoniae]